MTRDSNGNIRPAIIAALLTTTVGIVLISAAFAGYIFVPLALASRLLLVIAGLCLIPSPAASEVILVVNLVGLAIVDAVLIPLDLRRCAELVVKP